MKMFRVIAEKAGQKVETARLFKEGALKKAKGFLEQGYTVHLKEEK